MEASTSSGFKPQQAALDDAAGEALRNQQESNMVYGAFAASSSGLVPNANTDWDHGAGGLATSEHACDYCRVQSVQCVRRALTEVCQFCRERNLECVGPGNNRRTKLFASVDQSLPGQPPSSGEYEIGQSVIMRTGPDSWDSTPRIVKRVIYRPVAVVLDDDNNDPRPIDWIRPYPAMWPNGPPRPPANPQQPQPPQQPGQPPVIRVKVPPTQPANAQQTQQQQVQQLQQQTARTASGTPTSQLPTSAASTSASQAGTSAQPEPGPAAATTTSSTATPQQEEAQANDRDSSSTSASSSSSDEEEEQTGKDSKEANSDT